MQTDLLLVLDDPSDMAEQRIDLNMLSRVDSEQKATAAKVDEVGQELHDLGREVSEIKGAIRAAEIPWWVRYIASPICVAVILATGAAVIHLEIVAGGIRNNVSLVQASLATQNLTAYAALTPNEFKAKLPDVASDIAVARRHNVKVPPTVVDELSKRLSATESSAANFWQTAAQLISYRSALSHEDLVNLARSMPRCVDSPPSPATSARAIEEKDLGHPIFVPINSAHYDNCRIQIDSPEESAALAVQARNIPALAGVPLVFRHCLVVYKGGDVRLQTNAPVAFDDCLFQFDVYTAPPESGQKITENLLASNPDTFTIPAI